MEEVEQDAETVVRMGCFWCDLAYELESDH